MKSPREKEGKANQDDDEVPGRLRPPRPFDKTKPNCLENRVLGQEWITIRSSADPFRRCYADLQPRQTFVPLPPPPLPLKQA